MSMKTFVDNVAKWQLSFRAKGYEAEAMWVSEAGEKVINTALVSEKCVNDVEFVPCLKIHGIPVCVHRRMPAGAVWYVLRGGKK